MAVANTNLDLGKRTRKNKYNKKLVLISRRYTGDKVLHPVINIGNPVCSTDLHVHPNKLTRECGQIETIWFHSMQCKGSDLCTEEFSEVGQPSF